MTMKAQFKLAGIGIVRLWMHIVDRDPGANRMYAGSHLTNTETN